jgi:hypothetical protein
MATTTTARARKDDAMMLPPATTTPDATPRELTRLERLTILRELIVGDTSPPTSASWRKRAACATDDQALAADFTGDERNLPAERVEELRRICRGCPVIAECLLDDEATTIRDPWSIRGSLTADERTVLLRARRAAARKRRAAERERTSAERATKKATRRRPSTTGQAAAAA